MSAPCTSCAGNWTRISELDHVLEQIAELPGGEDAPIELVYWDEEATFFDGQVGKRASSAWARAMYRRGWVAASYSLTRVMRNRWRVLLQKLCDQ